MGAPAALTDHLAGRYRIDGVAGRGAMGVVYSAWDERHRRRVAIKVLDVDSAASARSQRFLREVRATSRLAHPGIVPLYDSGEAGAHLYYIMPLVEGESLRDRLGREHRLSVAEATRIACDLLRGLAYAHAHGVIHRDVKPANVLLPVAGSAMLADFGLADALEEVSAPALTSPGLALGTPTYMAPEQIEGRELDGRADLYAVGCVLFECLAGQPPFVAEGAGDVLRMHLTDEAPSIRRRRADVGTALDAALRKVLAKAPDDRFATAVDMLAALGDDRSPGTVRPAAPPASSDSLLRTLSLVWSRVRRPGTRRMARGALAGVALVSAAAAGWTLWTDRGGAPPPPALVLVAPFGGGMDAEGPASTQQAFLAALRDGGLEVAADGRADSALASDWAGLTAVQRRERGEASGASHLITGEVSGDDGGARLRVQIADVASGRSLGSFVGGGAGESLTRAAERLALQSLVALRDGGIETEGGRLGAETTSSVAVASLLAGRRLFVVERNMGAVVDQFDRAIAADSAFAPAYLWRALAEIWWPRFDFVEAARIVDVGIAHAATASPAWQGMLQGMRSYLRRDADASIREFGAVLSNTPELTEAWMMLGEALYHYGGWVGQRRAQAQTAFLEMVERDADFAPLYNHMAEIAMHEGDSVAARRYLDRLTGTDESRQIYHLAYRLHFSDAEDRGAALETLESADLRTMNGLVAHFAFGSAYLPLLDTLAGYLMGPNRTAAEVRSGERYRLVARAGLGAWDDAAELVASRARDPMDQYVVAAHLMGFDAADAYRPMVEGARARVAAAGPDVVAADPLDAEHRDLRVVVLDQFAFGDSSGIEPLLRFVRSGTGRAADAEPLTAALTHSLEARLALMAGDTAAAVSHLTAGLSRVPEPYLQHFPLATLAPQRLLLVDLLAATGRSGESERWATSFYETSAISDVMAHGRRTSTSSRPRGDGR